MLDENNDNLPPIMPYIIRAFYDWMNDCKLTPHIVVFTDDPLVQVPNKYTQNGKIILNIAPNAVRNSHMDKQILEFDASFDGDVMHLFIPIFAISAIYAQENGAGTIFSEEDRERQKKLYNLTKLEVVKSATKSTSTKKSTAKKSSTSRSAKSNPFTILDGGKNNSKN